MRKGDVAYIRMHKPLVVGNVLDEKVLMGNITEYDEEREYMYVQVQTKALEDMSLDAIYECGVKEDGEVVSFTGRIRERYLGEDGKIIRIQIENGFYKNKCKVC